MTTKQIKKKLDEFTAPEIAKKAKVPVDMIYNMKYGRIKDLDKIEKCLNACKNLTIAKKKREGKIKSTLVK